MATYKVRGNSHNVVYTYFNELGEKKANVGNLYDGG